MAYLGSCDPCATVSLRKGDCFVAHDKGMHPGAIWKKLDLQIHTPRDPQWSGSPHLPGGTPEAEAAREAWADGFVAHCIAVGLNGIAITDHHDICFIEYIEAAISRLPEGAPSLWLFPGMEVTCSDATQCLILFDQLTPVETVRRLYGGHLQNVDEPHRDSDRNPQANQCGQAIHDFFDSVSKDRRLAEVSIILPNAGDGGYKTMLRDGFHVRFATLPFDGVYIDGPHSGLRDFAQRKIYGKAQDWGNRRRGVLPTGDNRTQEFQKLGAYDCWVRLGEPTVEAIRQALLADEARIAYERPALPSHRLVELRIASTLTGPNFTLSLNDGFNAVIGGRGSGKSAVLEYLRFGLGRSAGDVVGGEEDYRERDQQLINETLAAGSVTVVIERDGVLETWTRSGTHRETINISSGDGEGVATSIAEAQQRFRARAFYQKQLSSLVSDRDRTAEQMTGIAAAEFVDARHALDRDTAAAKRDVLSAYQKLVEFWIEEEDQRRALAAVSDLEARLHSVQGRMTEAGLTTAQQDMLREAPSYSLAGTLIAEARLKLKSDQAMLADTMSRFASFRNDQWTPLFTKFPNLQQVVDRTEKAESELSATLDGAIAVFGELSADREVEFAKIENAAATFLAQHEQAVILQESGKALYEEAQKIIVDLQVAKTDFRRSEERTAELNTAPTQLDTARSALKAKVSTLTTLLHEAATKVEAMSGGSLRARVECEEVPKQQISALLAMCDGNRIRDLQTKCEDRARALADAATEDSWDKLADVLLQARRYRVQTGAISIELSERTGIALSAALFGDMTHQQLNGVFGKIDDATTGQLLTATAEDYISFEYRDAGRFIPFGQASPGQQAAALLQLLLSQEAGTLIIDQPEDDLDNRVIMDIAKLLQKTKRRRQLVFATHNPNFVVNGDADKIIVMMPGGHEAAEATASTPRISISVDSAIETRAVRTSVTETMEGGEAAFALRSRKYSFSTV